MSTISCECNFLGEINLGFSCSNEDPNEIEKNKENITYWLNKMLDSYEIEFFQSKEDVSGATVYISFKGK